MGKYLKKFDNHNDYEDFVDGGTMVKPNVSYCVQENEVHYNPFSYVDVYLTFVALEDGTFQLSTNVVSYSLDDGESWTELAADTASPTVTAGKKIMWKGELTPSSNNGIGTFSATGNFDVQGNVMSLLFGDNFKGRTDLTGKDNAFYQLFRGNTKVVNANKFILPASTLTNQRYNNMFFGCTGLVTAPELPATTLALGCYQSMFFGCTGLVTAPVLPATTLANNCYRQMFYNCSGLTTAPVLPATTLADWCYSYMFFGCTSLTTAPVLPATTLVNSCYRYMFFGCTGLTTAPELPATTLAESCYGGMFQGCTSLVSASELPAPTLAQSCYGDMFRNCTGLTTAPELPATTLAWGCYSSMFYGCTSLTTAPELPASTLTNQCYNNMFFGCTGLVTAPELPATTLAEYCYYGMFRGCTSLNYIKAMFTTTPSSIYTDSWVSGVSATGTFVKNSAATWNITGVNGVPTGWTIETASE